MTTLKPGHWIAVCIFGLTEKSEIRAMIKKLRLLAQAGRVPSKRIGNRFYYYSEWFLQPDKVTADQPAFWMLGR